MSRPKKLLPVIGQPPVEEPPVREPVESDPAGETDRTVVRVEGMDCASCALTVEKHVSALPGMRRAVVNFAAGRLDAEHASELSVEEIEAAVRNAGYDVGRDEGIQRTPFWRTPRTLMTAASALLFLTGLALSLTGAPDVARTAVYSTAIVVGGYHIFRAALAGLRARHLDMNVLMGAATIGAVGIGQWAEAASVVVLFSAGNALQIYAVDRTRGAVRALAQLAPDEVLVRRGVSEVVVPVEEVAAGEVVVVHPGERLAVDGEVVEGASAVNEAPITGESIPVEKGAGDPVYSGSLNGPGGLLVRTTKQVGDSTLQRITRLVEEAQAGKAPSEQFVDRFSRVYTPVVVAVAITLAAVPPLLGAPFGEWFYRALAMLIIACPCALVISTPVTVVSGIGAASRRGILVKGGAALEAAGRLKVLAFDKTGTLTEGRPVVSRVMPLNSEDDATALRLAAAVERRSEHPLAHAILTAAEARNSGDLPSVSSFRSIPGRGAEGEVEGVRLVVGSLRLFEEEGIPLHGAEAALTEISHAGETPVLLGGEGGALAIFGLADAMRPDARRTLESLRDAGLQVLVMLTGDADAPARRIAGELGIEYQARLLPEDKVEAVRDLVRKNGAAGMVGDGVNDAPAMAASSVGFAMGAAGTDVALETADVALMRDDLPKLAEAVKLSRTAERIIRQNVFVSIAIKGIFVLLAPFGLVALWLAVLADMGTSIAVTLNGLRLFRHRLV